MAGPRQKPSGWFSRRPPTSSMLSHSAPRSSGALATRLCSPRVIERGRNGALRRIKGPPKRQDITYIDDAVEAHLIAADLLLVGGDGARRINGRPYFVSSGEPVEIWDFVNGLPRGRRGAPGS